MQHVVGAVQCDSGVLQCGLGAVQVYSYVLAFEVLDNLPHDCVLRGDATSDWQEVIVRREACGEPRLEGRPLQDALVQRTLASAQWAAEGEASLRADGSLCSSELWLFGPLDMLWREQRAVPFLRQCSKVPRRHEHFSGTVPPALLHGASPA